MRERIVAVLMLVAVCPSAAAFSLQFASPATVEGSSLTLGSTSFAMRLPPGAEVRIDLLFDASVVETNVTYQARASTPFTFYETPPEATEKRFSLGRQSITLRAASEGATLAVVHEGGIRAQGRMGLNPINGRSPSALVDAGQTQPGWSPIWSPLPVQGVALQAPNVTVQLEALPVQAIEWFNMNVACNEAIACPSGGGASRQEVMLTGTTLSSASYVFERLEGAASLSANLSSVALAIGSETLHVFVDGRVHLPVAAGTTCPDCPPLQGQTLALSGHIDLKGVRDSPDGFMADISGEFDSARVDETWVSPEALTGATVTAVAVVGAALLIKLALVPLFTRLSKQEALEHPKRQKIFAYVQEHPGANFREVARSTGIASGTVRHHLTVLERAGHLVEHQHQGTVRLFENHGKFDHNWADMVLLREPPLAQVHDWLKQHAASPQKNILEAFEQLGWSRSTTQHRLARLVEGGLVSIRLQGRLKIYSVVERQAPRIPLVGQVSPRMLAG